MSMKKKLWEYVRWMLKESDEEPQEDLLTEPDYAEDPNEKKEVAVGGVAGVMTPLGTNATYPSPDTKKRKSPAKAAGDAFGGAKPHKKS